MRPTGPPVRLRFDGREIEALPGETIAAALAAADIVAVRQARSGAPRGPFCGMGVCFDCLVTVDGRPNQRACLDQGPGRHGCPLGSPSPRRGKPSRPRPREEIACDVLVVGAGPAGLSAARALALAGANVIVADERLHPGGQYFKPLAPSHQADPSTLDRQFRDGAILRQSALLAGVRILNEATVWAAFSPHEVAAIVGRPFDPFPAQAPGAGDRRLRAVAAGAGLDLAGRHDGGRAADPGALLSRGAGPAHRGRRQRPALPADRRRASRRRRQCRRRPRSSQPPRPCPMARSSGRRFGRARPADRRPGPRQRGCAACCTGIAG